MKKTRLIIVLLLIVMFGVLSLTAQGYVACQDDSPDEFLDLAAASQNPNLPVFAPRMDVHPFSVTLLKIFGLQETNFYTTSLRC